MSGLRRAPAEPRLDARSSIPEYAALTFLGAESDVRSLPPVDVPIALFYRHRCLVCEDAMRRKRDDQRFKNGHKTCQNEYRRFPHVFDYPGVNPGHPTGVAMSASQTLDSSGSKVAVG